MADIRPFRALRYDPATAGDPTTLIAPPYDVVSDEDKQALYRRGPFNVSLVDYGEEEPGDDAVYNRYTRARDDLAAWRNLDVLRRDSGPRMYVYDQEFVLKGEKKKRRALFVRLRLEDWDAGVVLPHEVTGEHAKADRLNLLQATRVHTSPILALYRPGLASISDWAVGFPLFEAVFPESRHVLANLERDAAEAVATALEDQKLYIADGHHRYETALNYRNQRRAEAAGWTGEEPENFILAALVDAADPGLVVLPTHRLLRLASRDGLVAGLSELFNVEDAGAVDTANVDALSAKLEAAGQNGAAFGAIGLEPGRLHLITPRSLSSVLARTPDGHSEAWRRLDVTILQHALLPLLGFPTLEAREEPDNIDYTEDAQSAAEAVTSGRADAALLLNPTPVESIFEVADAGERMPRKSTFFFPKLATGMLMFPLE